MKLTRPSCDTDHTPVTFNEDQKAVCLKTIQDITGALSWLYDLVKADQLQVCNRYTSLYLSTHRLQELAKTVGYDDDLKVMEADRVESLRAANLEIHRLKEQMGNLQPIDAIEPLLNRLQRVVYDFWKLHGFLTSKGAFTPYYYHADLSCHIDCYGGSTDSKTPISDKKAAKDRIALLRESLALIAESEGSPREYVLDTPSNRFWIEDTLSERFPGAEITDWQLIRHNFGPGNKPFILRDCKVLIPLQSI